MARRTAEEIAELQRQWLADPICDLWDTEGFEDHQDELRAYQTTMERVWQAERQQERQRQMADIGLSDSPAHDRLFDYLQKLERRITSLETDNERLQGEVNRLEVQIGRVDKDLRYFRSDLHSLNSRID